VNDIIHSFCAAYNSLMYPNKPHEHNKRVDQIRSEIREWISEGCKTKLCTARPGWQAMSLRAGKYKSTYRNISVNLFDVLEINEDKKTCRVEPMCSMGKLTHALLPQGWTIPVVPELDDLTVGGLVAGVGIETSSHKYGLFQHICVSFEVVMADGSLVNCSASENSDLFYSIPWSHGTLGFVVSVELQIIRARPYVELTYLPFHSKREAIQSFATHSTERKYDFVECLAFSKEEYVVMVGNLTDSRNIIGATYNPIGMWYKEWFYKHVERFLGGKNGTAKAKAVGKSSEQHALLTARYREIIPLRDYYHRHTRSLFWEMADIVPFGNNPVFRMFLGWMMPPKPSLLKRTQTEALRKLYELHHMVQDMLVPMSQLSDCLDVFDEQAGIYPLWLCPFKIPSNAGATGVGQSASTSPSGNRRKSARLLEASGGAGQERGFIHPCDGGKGEDMFVDVGAYGNPSVPLYEARASHRNIEEYVRSVQGYQMMYADSYMTRDEFRAMFDHSLYDKLRDSLPMCKQAFPEVYDKVSKAARI